MGSLQGGSLTSGSFLAETAVRSPRKIIIFITRISIFWIQVSKNILFNIEDRTTARGPRRHKAVTAQQCSLAG